MSDKRQFVAKLRQAKACRTSNCITTDKMESVVSFLIDLSILLILSIIFLVHETD